MRLLLRAFLCGAVVAVASCSRRTSENSPQPRLIYTDSNGRRLTDQDLSTASGTVKWSLADSSSIPAAARLLHEQARTAGSKVDFEKARALLEQARRQAPDWPYPVYDAAYTHLLMGHDEKALENYERVVKMSPRGFFTAITAVDTLRREKAGGLPRGSYKKLLEVEWMDKPTKQEAALRAMLKRSPSFAPAWKELASLLKDDARKKQAIEKGLSHQPDAETRGFLLINKALLLRREGKAEEATKILGDLALDPKSPEDIEQIAKGVLLQATSSR